MADPAVISWFDDSEEGGNEYGFLSNFWVGEPLRFARRTYPTGEHLFQAFKTRTRADHDMIVACPTPGEARATGKRMLRLRPDWERVKYDAMRLVLATKFREGRAEKGLLLATGDALLVEGTMWDDRVWGVDLKEGRAAWARRFEVTGMSWEAGEGWEDAPGRNWLGTLLMARRAELVFEQADSRRPRAIYQSVAQFTMDVPK